MIFGGKQLNEKNRIIQLLENEKDNLQIELKALETANDNLKKREADLGVQVSELLQKVKDLDAALERQQEISRLSQLKVSEMQNEAEELRTRLSLAEHTFQNVEADNKKLSQEMEKYRKMSPDEYLKLGTELFTLEKLTYILEEAQSEAFVSVQKGQKRNILQNLINDIQILLCPIKSDDDLLKLILMVDADTEKDIKYIRKNLDKVSLQQIVSSASVDKRQCGLQKRIYMPSVSDNINVFDAENANEYMRKIALSRLANVFYQIANWKGY